MGGGIGVIRAVQGSAILSFVAQAFQYDADLVFREKCRCRVARRIFALLGLPDTTRHSQTGSQNPADTRRKQTGHRNPPTLASDGGACERPMPSGPGALQTKPPAWA